MSSAGVINVDQVFYKIGVEHAFGHVLVVSDGDQPGDTIIITELDGEILAERTRPTPNIRYFGNGQPRGTRPKTRERHRSPETSQPLGRTARIARSSPTNPLR